MSVDTGFSGPIIEYISEHFPNANIEEWEHEKKESLNFRIHENEVTYVLRVMDECLIGQQLVDIKPMLESYHVAQVVRDVRDFPIIVTNCGCIFGSP
jgi:hypothetical protein